MLPAISQISCGVMRVSLCVRECSCSRVIFSGAALDELAAGYGITLTFSDPSVDLCNVGCSTGCSISSCVNGEPTSLHFELDQVSQAPGHASATLLNQLTYVGQCHEQMSPQTRAACLTTLSLLSCAQLRDVSVCLLVRSWLERAGAYRHC